MDLRGRSGGDCGAEGKEGGSFEAVTRSESRSDSVAKRGEEMEERRGVVVLLVLVEVRKEEEDAAVYGAPVVMAASCGRCCSSSVLGGWGYCEEFRFWFE